MSVWLLKARKDHYNLLDEIRKGKTESWPATSWGHLKQMQKQDRVFLYQKKVPDSI